MKNLVCENLSNFLLEYSSGLINKVTKKFQAEDDNLTDEQILYYINMFDRHSKKSIFKNKDITRYAFKELKELIDSNFRKVEPNKIVKSNITNDNNSNSNPDILYDEDGLIIYLVDTREKAIKYRCGAPWCISDDDSSNIFSQFRHSSNEIVMYFIFDKSLPKSNPTNSLVLMVNKNGKYSVTDNNNGLDLGDEDYSRENISWDNLVKIQPKIKDLRHLLKPKPLTAKEKKIYNSIKKPIDVPNLMTHFKDYSLVDAYIGRSHELSDSQFLSLPNDLKNKYLLKNTSSISDVMFDSLTNNLKHLYFKRRTRGRYQLSVHQFSALSNIDKTEYLRTLIDISDELYKTLTDKQKNLYWDKFLENDRLRFIMTEFQFITTPNSLVREKYLNEFHVELTAAQYESLSKEEIENLSDEVKASIQHYLLGIPNNLVFPPVMEKFNMGNVRSLPDNFKLPEIKGDITFRRLKKLPDNFKFPEIINGYLDLFSLTTLENGIILPKKVNNIRLDGLKHISADVKLPIQCHSISLNEIKKLPDNFKLPDVKDDIFLNHLEYLPKKFYQNQFKRLWLYSLKEFPKNFDISKMSGQLYIGEDVKIPKSLINLTSKYKKRGNKSKIVICKWHNIHHIYI